MFLAVIGVIVIANFTYLAITLYEQYQVHKREKARERLVEKHGVLPIAKLVEIRFNLGRK